MARIFFKKQEQQPSILVSLSLTIAVLALLLGIIAGPLYGLGLYGDHSNSAINLTFRLNMAYAGVGAALLGMIFLLLGLVHGRTSIRARVSWRGWVAALLLMCTLAPAGKLLNDYRRYPALNDISTDLEDPPIFLTPLDTQDTDVTSSYDRPFSYSESHIQDQRYYYQHIKTVTSMLDYPVAVALAKETIESLGWTLISEKSRKTGPEKINEKIIEASHTDPLFGFNHDIVVRISLPVKSNGLTPGALKASSSDKVLIDIRSLSDFGSVDFGTNAKQISHFMKKFDLLEQAAKKE